jgi:hypothetical protein
MSQPTRHARYANLQGRTCIYREKLFIVAVEVISVQDDGFLESLKLRVLNLPGFGSSGTVELEVSRSAFFGGWLLYDEPDMVDAVIAFAATLPEGADNRGELFDFLAKTDRDDQTAHPSD